MMYPLVKERDLSQLQRKPVCETGSFWTLGTQYTFAYGSSPMIVAFSIQLREINKNRRVKYDYISQGTNFGHILTLFQFRAAIGGCRCKIVQDSRQLRCNRRQAATKVVFTLLGLWRKWKWSFQYVIEGHSVMQHLLSVEMKIGVSQCPTKYPEKEIKRCISAPHIPHFSPTSSILQCQKFYNVCSINHSHNIQNDQHSPTMEQSWVAAHKLSLPTLMPEQKMGKQPN